MIKILYEFIISKEEEIEKQEESVNEAGEKVTVTKKIKEQMPHKFFLARPSRALQEEAELYRAVKFSEAVKRGVLTHDLLSKRLKNDEGLLSTQEQEEYKKMYNDLYTDHVAIQKLAEKPEKDRSEEEKKEYNNLLEKIGQLRRTIREFETSKSNLFNFTAETYARSKTVFWWLLYLSYKSNQKGEPEPLFTGKDLETKLHTYDEIEEKNDPFLNEVIQKFMYYATLWFISEVSTPERFVELVKEAEEEDKKQLK